ncbi:MAG: transcriptional regulator [Candidatus Omnitrophica bacterium CG23_combo_of_CG06-09_8_20_14_all_41_10]|uniref:Transcriptional regulator n=1 Tax=Candidatus Sherwoodlollariibacterium unditelluris TaxID=1974757 RepID=A0A2G9YJT5_9BACT|nr:MAG: transcriptional regulator [Candidatus Omnitrophica bacterium CG23_combo_of_CG06-09_8_20_14_all_41_10]
MSKGQRDVCELFCYNKAKVNALKKSLPSANKLTRLAEIFKVLGDTTRVKILLSLSKGELCVCDISHVLGLSISAVSHQLRLLRSLGLVKYRSEGKMAFYTLDNEHVMRLIDEGMRHIEKR